MATGPAIDSRIRRYFLFQVLWSFELWHPFWTLWLLQNLRNDFFSATLVDVVFWLVGLLFAMPAGALADRYGRKPALVFGIVLWNVGVVLFGLAGSLPAFALANAAWAFGAAFMFSCGSAYLYDTLAEGGQEGRYPREVSRATLLGFLATAAGCAIGGIVVTATRSFQVSLLLNVVTGIAAIGTALTFREPSVHRLAASNLLAQIRTGLRITRDDRQIVFLILFQVLVGIVTYVMAFFRAPYMQALVAGDFLVLGLAFAGFFAVAAAAGISFEKILNRLGETGALVLTFLLVFPPFAAVYIVSLGVFSPGFALLVGVLTQICFYIIWGLESPVVTTIINRRVLSSDRATVLSVSTFFTTLAIAIMEPIVGLLAATYDLAVGLTILAALAAVPSAYAVVAYRTAGTKARLSSTAPTSAKR